MDSHSSDLQGTVNPETANPATLDSESSGIIIIDHGSRRSESNQRLLEFVELFRQRSNFRVVEPAHMELAEPDLLSAFQACLQQNAKSIVVSPFFLLPGRHWQDDIPRLAQEASQACDNVPYIVTSPLGIHEKLVDVMLDRIRYCVEDDSGEPCSNCTDFKRCHTQ